MTIHRVTETESELPELVDRALAGDDVIITRQGQVVARIVSAIEIKHEPKRITDETIDWLMRNRVGKQTMPIDSGTLVREMRDED